MKGPKRRSLTPICRIEVNNFYCLVNCSVGLVFLSSSILTLVSCLPHSSSLVSCLPHFLLSSLVFLTSYSRLLSSSLLTLVSCLPHFLLSCFLSPHDSVRGRFLVPFSVGGREVAEADSMEVTLRCTSAVLVIALSIAARSGSGNSDSSHVSCPNADSKR